MQRIHCFAARAVAPGAALLFVWLVLSACGSGTAALHPAEQPAGASAQPNSPHAPAPAPHYAPESPAITHSTSGFTLRVLPASFADGASASDVTLVVVPALVVPASSGQPASRQDGGTTEITVSVVDARALKGLYFELDYDPAQYDPQDAQTTSALADSAAASDGVSPGERCLTLSVLGQAGTAALGQTLTHPADQPGFSGQGATAFARLSFARRPFSPRSVSAAPVSPKSAPTLSLDNTTRQLSWGYYCQGDYDQNGETNISDLQPIGVNYHKSSAVPGQAFDPSSAESAVDGDDNGEINISDLQPIGANYHRAVAGYHIYSSASEADKPAGPGDVSTLTPDSDILINAADGDAHHVRRSFSFTYPTLADQSYVWVRPFDGDTEGTSSNTVQYNSPNVKPLAGIIANVLSGAATLNVTLDASASHDPDGSIAKYEFDWDGADGGINYVDNGPVATVVHAYANAGSYKPIVRVTDNSGATATATLSAPIVVGPHVNHLPTAVLAAAPSGGAPPLQVNFNAVASADSDGTLVQYDYDFDGDGVYDETGNADTTLHTYNAEGSFTAKLRVHDNEGGTATATKQIFVSSTPFAPNAVLTASRYFCQNGSTITYDASGSNDPDGSITKYEWNWSYDGNNFIANEDSGTNPIVTHQWNTNGSYLIAVRVTDNDSQTSVATATIKVFPAGVYDPVGFLSANPRYGPAPLDVTFDATLSYDVDGTIDHYDWDWDGDGTYEVLDGLPVQTHSFAKGVFDTTVRVTDNDGHQATKIMLVWATLGANVPADDCIFALPSQSKAHDGDVVTIEVYSKKAANPLQYLNGAGLTMENSNVYASNSYNVGSISLDPADLTPDGVWSTMHPLDSFLLAPDAFIQPEDLGGGRQRYDFVVVPLGGADIINATGALFNFGLTIHSSVSLNFQEEDGAQIKRTYYANSGVGDYFWSTDTNGGAPSITLIP